MMPIGLTDKLYWRFIGGRSHCFKRERCEKTWTSLCGRFEIGRSYGGATNRPLAELRCPICDGREMERRGKAESLPENKGCRIQAAEPIG